MFWKSQPPETLDAAVPGYPFTASETATTTSTINNTSYRAFDLSGDLVSKSLWRVLSLLLEPERCHDPDESYILASHLRVVELDFPKEKARRAGARLLEEWAAVEV